MKNESVIKKITYSFAAIVVLGTSAEAGKILTDANLSDINVTENKQFGFGGWNFDNVDVRIVNVNDFSGNEGEFDTTSGTYSPMDHNMSFESDIKNGTDGEIMAHLHGKDWPVGEPAGIKIINNDTKVEHGKPVNCIMTTSYQEFQSPNDHSSGYLDAFEEGNMPNPVICSSPFQTHKRFKINLLPSTIEELDAEGYGKPVELVFNLDPSDTDSNITRYQVLQKINNYTGQRLDGYKIEVVDADGNAKNPALTLSIGEGEGDEGSNIWDETELANMSHGLWGPYEEVNGVVRFEDGFFDYQRAYYPVVLSDDNHTISYTGDMLGGNYQDIFGNWLPAIWAPIGIFHDDDQNPETDGILKAFLGVAPGKNERAWYKRDVNTTDPKNPVYTWYKATEEDFMNWSGDWYEEDTIEDVLNLGLNYIINIGSNQLIGDTFTLRITPHVDTNDQTPPSNYITLSNDFTGNGMNDILWHKQSTGAVKIMEMNGLSPVADKTVVTTSNINLIPKGIADMTGDDKIDILFHNQNSGKVLLWEMNGTTKVQNIDILESSNVNLKVAGMGDFDGDGDNDIATFNTNSGTLVIWEMDGTTKIENKTVLSGLNVNLVPQGVGDMDNDGIPDIVLRNNASGAARIWTMNNDWTRKGNELIVETSNTNLELRGVMDLNGDGNNDILNYNTNTGMLRSWLMDGNFSIVENVEIKLEEDLDWSARN